MAFRHGTRYDYRKAKCRCQSCKDWQAGDMRAYRIRHPRPRPVGWASYNARRSYANG